MLKSVNLQMPEIQFGGKGNKRDLIDQLWAIPGPDPALHHLQSDQRKI